MYTSAIQNANGEIKFIIIM